MSGGEQFVYFLMGTGIAAFVLALQIIHNAKDSQNEQKAEIRDMAARDLLARIKEHNRSTAPLSHVRDLFSELDFIPEPSAIVRELEAPVAANESVRNNADDLEFQMESIRQSIRSAAEKVRQ